MRSGHCSVGKYLNEWNVPKVHPYFLICLFTDCYHLKLAKAAIAYQQSSSTKFPASSTSSNGVKGGDTVSVYLSMT